MTGGGNWPSWLSRLAGGLCRHENPAKTIFGRSNRMGSHVRREISVSHPNGRNNTSVHAQFSRKPVSGRMCIRFSGRLSVRRIEKIVGTVIVVLRHGYRRIYVTLCQVVQRVTGQ